MIHQCAAQSSGFTAQPTVLTVATDSVSGAESGGGFTLVLVGQHQADGQEPDVGEVHPGLPLLSLRVRFPTVAAGGSRRNTGTRRGSHSAPCRKGSSTSSTSPSQVQSRFLESAARRSAAQLAEPFHPSEGRSCRREAGGGVLWDTPPQLGLIAAPSCRVLLSPTVVPLDHQRCASTRRH